MDGPVASAVTGDSLPEAEQVPVQTFAEPAPTSATLIVIRHGERQDEVDKNWSEESSSPWDPPLSQHGREQGAQAAKLLADYAVQRVVTSPFARCLETTAVLMEALELPWERCAVDCRFGEATRCAR